MIKGNCYDFIFPLGDACFVANTLKKYDMRRFSCPFDWVGMASLDMRLQIFLNDFADFFNKEDLVLKDPQHSISPHSDVCINTRFRAVFPHDFPKGVPFDVSFPKIKEKYDRRIERLRSSICESSRGLLLFIAMPTTAASDTDTLVSLMRQVQEKHPSTPIDLLYVKHNPALSEKKILWQQPSPNFFIAEINNEGLDCDDFTYFNLLNIKAVLDNIRLSAPPVWKTLRYKIRKWAQKMSEKIGRNIYCIRNEDGQSYTRILGMRFRSKTADSRF